MLRPIDDLPTGAVGFEAHGRVTAAERRKVIEPRLQSEVRRGRKVRLLYVAASDFDGYDRGGVYDDAVFGSRHFADFEKIAFVAEDGPYARSVKALDGLMPAKLRVFRSADIGAAREWLAA